MYSNKFKLALVTLCLGGYLFLWYQDAVISPFHAAVWVFLAFIDELKEYLNNR
jgi:hypothetical protein